MDIKQIMINALLFCAISLFSLQSYAIVVNVQSNSDQLMGLGFTVNGQQFGGMGNNYSKDDAPVGNYAFGVRTNRDIGCFTRDGKKTVVLKKNTNAFLQFDGKKCLLKLSSS